MSWAHLLLNGLIWPGQAFCEAVGQDPHEDGGMLRGYVNSIVWGLAAAVVVLLAI